MTTTSTSGGRKRTDAWKQVVRQRLEKGETITGVQVREEAGRRVPIYTFLDHLEEREGWVFEKKSKEIDGHRLPVTHYRLVEKTQPKNPPPTGPRSDRPEEERPTNVVMRRLLAGEELEGKTIAEELGVTSSLLTYVKGQMKQAGYRFDERRDGVRMFVKLASTTPDPKTRGGPLDKVIDVPPPKTMDFGLFEIKLTNGKARI